MTVTTNQSGQRSTDRHTCSGPLSGSLWSWKKYLGNLFQYFILGTKDINIFNPLHTLNVGTCVDKGWNYQHGNSAFYFAESPAVGFCMFININSTNVDQSCNTYNFTLCGASCLNCCILDFFILYNSAQKRVQEVPKCKAERVVSVSSSTAFTFWVKYLYNLHVWFHLSSRT